MSITELLLTAVESLMASPGPRVTVAESTRRFAVSGAQLESVNIVSLETYQRINNDAEPTVATR